VLTRRKILKLFGLAPVALVIPLPKTKPNISDLRIFWATQPVVCGPMTKLAQQVMWRNSLEHQLLYGNPAWMTRKLYDESNKTQDT